MTLPPVTQTQRKLVLDDTPALVLATVSDARLRLPGHDEDDILALVDEGFLLAWDISLSPGLTARELRLLPQSIDLYARAGDKSKSVSAHSALRTPHSPFLSTWPQLILGRHHDKPFLFSTTIKLLLNCGATHVTNLVDAAAFKCLPLESFSSSSSSSNQFYRRGPHGAACIQRESFLSFLKARLL